MYTGSGQFIKTFATGVEPHQMTYLYGIVTR